MTLLFPGRIITLLVASQGLLAPAFPFLRDVLHVHRPQVYIQMVAPGKGFRVPRAPAVGTGESLRFEMSVLVALQVVVSGCGEFTAIP